MVAFNFSPRFAPLVESGAKTQTIRRTARATVGKRIQLYVGQRTPDCRKLVDPDPVCILCQYVALRPDSITVGNVADHPRDFDAFARLDGFEGYDDMLGWFERMYGSRYFVGYLTRWKVS